MTKPTKTLAEMRAAALKAVADHEHDLQNDPVYRALYEAKYDAPAPQQPPKDKP